MKHSAVWERSRQKTEQKNKGKRLNMREVMEKIGCSKASVYRLISEGKLPAVALFGSGRGMRVYEAEVEEYIKTREVETC